MENKHYYFFYFVAATATIEIPDCGQQYYIFSSMHFWQMPFCRKNLRIKWLFCLRNSYCDAHANEYIIIITILLLYITLQIFHKLFGGFLVTIDSVLYITRHASILRRCSVNIIIWQASWTHGSIYISQPPSTYTHSSQ